MIPACLYTLIITQTRALMVGGKREKFKLFLVKESEKSGNPAILETLRCVLSLLRLVKLSHCHFRKLSWFLTLRRLKRRLCTPYCTRSLHYQSGVITAFGDRGTSEALQPLPCMRLSKVSVAHNYCGLIDTFRFMQMNYVLE